MGILSTGSSIGGVVFPIMVSRLIASVGYGWAMRTCAFMISLLLFIAILTVRARPSARVAYAKPDMAKPFKEFGFVALMVGMFLMTFGIFVPLTYIPIQALSDGMKPELVQYLVAMLNAARCEGHDSPLRVVITDEQYLVSSAVSSPAHCRIGSEDSTHSSSRATPPASSYSRFGSRARVTVPSLHLPSFSASSPELM